MRIAHFLLGHCNPDSANGVEKTVYFLAKTQASLGHNVSLFNITARPQIPIDDVEVNRYSTSSNPFRLPSNLVMNLVSWQPDIVHLHSVYTPVNVVLARHLNFREIPYVVTPHGALSSYVLRRKAYLKIPYKLMLERPYLNRAAFVHCVSKLELDDVRAYGVTAPTILAPNGLDMAVLPQEVDSGLLLRRYPELQGKRIFLFLGRLEPMQKGLDLLLQAVHMARRALVNSALVLVGPDWRGHRARLERMVEKLDIGSQVIFAGPAYGKEKFDLLAGADVFVHTSRFEGFPFSVLEALACGKPCLVSKANNLEHYNSRYQVGIVVGLDTADIAKALSRFAEMPRSKLSEMGENSKSLVASEFRWDAIASTITVAYEQVRVNNR